MITKYDEQSGNVFFIHFARIFYILFLKILLSLSFPVQAQMYVSLDWNFAVAMSDSDFNNGASGGSPGIAFGVRVNRISPEFFYKRLSFSKEHRDNSSGEVETDITANTLGAGVRFYHHPSIYSKFGLSFHFVTAEYESSKSGVELESAIDQTWTAPYLGGGLNFSLNNRWQTFTDLTFYLSGAEYSAFVWEFGIRYIFP